AHILIEDLNPSGIPTKLLGELDQVVLSLGRLLVLMDLHQGGLADVHQRRPVQVLRPNLFAHRMPRVGSGALSGPSAALWPGRRATRASAAPGVRRRARRVSPLGTDSRSRLFAAPASWPFPSDLLLRSSTRARSSRSAPGCSIGHFLPTLSGGG